MSRNRKSKPNSHIHQLAHQDYTSQVFKPHHFVMYTMTFYLYAKKRVMLPNRIKFQKNSKRPSTPLTPHFRKVTLQNFYAKYGRIYARRYDSQKIKWFINAFFRVCLVLIFFGIQLLKKHNLNPEMTKLHQFHDLKTPCLKFPKSAIYRVIFF